MALAYDTSNSQYQGGGAANSISVTAASANSIAVIFLFWGTGGSHAPNATGVTVAGSSSGVTQIGSDFTAADSSYKIRAYYYLNPPTSATTYACGMTNTSDDNTLHVLIYSGAKQSGQVDSSNTGSSASPLTLSTTVVTSNCWLVSAVRDRGGAPSASTGTTMRQNPGPNANQSGDSNGVVGTGAQTMAWTGSGVIGGFIVSIAPSGAAVSTVNPHNNLPLLGVS
jgi:hypothetical protein